MSNGEFLGEIPQVSGERLSTISDAGSTSADPEVREKANYANSTWLERYWSAKPSELGNDTRLNIANRMAVRDVRE